MATIRMDSWHGDEPPVVGAWIASERPRVVYEITAVKPLRSGLGTRRYLLTVTRHVPSEVPEGATRYLMRWNSRRRRRR